MTYAGVTALRLGRRVGIVTACAPDIVLPAELDAAEVLRVPSPTTCTFAHEVAGAHRALHLVARAAPLAPAQVPAAWRGAPIVHLAPVMGELPATLAARCAAPLVGATLQGWLRQADEGRVVSDPAALDDLPCGGLAAAVLSDDDLGGDLRAVAPLTARVGTVVVTRGAAGSTLYQQGRSTEIPPYPVEEVDATGAGDVFAAAFFIHLAETGDAVASAVFASCAAGLSVTGPGIERIPERPEIHARLRAWR